MTRSQPPAPTLRLSGPADLIEAVPFLLGFHPQRSLVLLGLGGDGGRRVTVTARMDLDDVSDGLDDTLCAVARSGADAVVAILYAANVDDQSWVDLIYRAARDIDLEPIDVLRVDAGRWRSLQCEDTRCCPPDGRPLAGNASSTAAAATYAGLVAWPDREQLARTLDPCGDDDRAALLPLLEDAEEDAMRAILAGGQERRRRADKRAIFAAARDADRTLFRAELAGTQLARFATALADVAVRDPVWLAVDQGRLCGRALWAELARRVPAPYDAPALFLFGWAEWRSGNGVLAGIAAERALRSDPDYTAADLLLASLRHGLDPGRTPRLRMPRSA